MKSNKYTEREIEFLKINYFNKGGKWCGEQLNRNPDSIRHLAKKLGLKASRNILAEGARARFTSLQDYDQFIIDNYSIKGKDWCAKELNIKSKQVQYLARKHKLYKEIQPEDYKLNYKNITIIDSPIQAYILGLLWTDGHISKKTNSIIFSTTEPDAQYFIPIFLKTGPWDIYRKFPKNKKWKEKVMICTTNKFLHQFLKEFDFSNKTVGFKKIYNYIPEEYRKYFIIGIVDGDGCFYHGAKNSSFSVASCIDQNWDILIELANFLKISFSIENTISKNGKYSKFRLSSKWPVTIFSNYIYDNKDLSIGLPRKKNKALEIKDSIKRKRPIKILNN